MRVTITWTDPHLYDGIMGLPRISDKAAMESARKALVMFGEPDTAPEGKAVCE